MITTYIIYANENLARGASYNAIIEKTKGTMYKWSSLVSLDRKKSCLILEKKPDSIDFITGEAVKTKCSYNDFLEFINTNTTFNTYTESTTLDSNNWNLEL